MATGDATAFPLQHPADYARVYRPPQVPHRVAQHRHRRTAIFSDSDYPRYRDPLAERRSFMEWSARLRSDAQPCARAPKERACRPATARYLARPRPPAATAPPGNDFAARAASRPESRRQVWRMSHADAVISTSRHRDGARPLPFRATHPKNDRRTRFVQAAFVERLRRIAEIPLQRI